MMNFSGRNLHLIGWSCLICKIHSREFPPGALNGAVSELGLQVIMVQCPGWQVSHPRILQSGQSGREQRHFRGLRQGQEESGKAPFEKLCPREVLREAQVLTDDGKHGEKHFKIPWRRPWQPTPVFLAGEFHGQRSLVDYSPWGRESDKTEQLTCSIYV